MFRLPFRLLLAICVFLASVSAATAAQSDVVNVLYAGSLVNLMERAVGPAFEQQTGLKFRGYAAGSNKIANEIKGKLRRGDVFISASPKVNQHLLGPENGTHISWYLNFAESPLMIGYNPKSPFAGDFKTKRWDSVLQAPGIRIGRTDPLLDPKGALTIEMVDKAATLYGQPNLAVKILGAADNPSQVLPEETLIGRLQSGQLDAGFFYATETTFLHIPAILPAPELHVQAHYTLTILNDASNAAGAARFVAFLLSAQGRALLKAHGLDLVTPTLTGDASSLPASLDIPRAR